MSGLLVAGARLGRYVFEARIASGAMSSVWRAWDRVAEQAVALKILPGRDGVDLATALKALLHPHVVRVLDGGRIEHRSYLALELLEGGDLEAWLAAAPPVEQILVRFGECAEGLAAAHARGVVHGDFKPENALFGADGRLRVIDFGATAQTAGYLAPERRHGAPASPAADQYALCAALYQALYGRLPASEPTFEGRADLPADLPALLARGLEPSAEARHGSMAQLAGALRNATARGIQPNRPVLAPRLDRCAR